MDRRKERSKDDEKKYNKTLKQRLQESLDKASADDKKVISESLETLGINLNEDENSDRMEVNHELYKDDTQVTEDFRNDPLRQIIYDIADYFDEAGYPIKSNA